MQRVMIIGCSGSGKSTLARKLAERTGLPLIHLDREYWQPGWVKPPEAEWPAKVAALCARPRWIIDGNFGATLPIRLRAADTVIFLDFPRSACLRGVLGRIVGTYGRTRDDAGPGCPERIDLEFLLWVWKWRRNSRPRTVAALKDFHGALHVLRNRKEAVQFLEKL